MKSVKRKNRKYAAFLLILSLLTACGNKEPETTVNPQEPETVTLDDGNGDVTPEPSGEDTEIQPAEQPDEELSGQPAKEGNGDLNAQPTEEPGSDGEETPEAEGHRIVIVRGSSATAEVWEQLEQDDDIMIFCDGYFSYYVEPAQEIIYVRENYAHERAEGSEYAYFIPQYSSKSDETMFATGGTDENGNQLYDVYYGKELLLSGLSLTVDGRPLDMCYDADRGEIMLITCYKDLEKKEDDCLLYRISKEDGQIRLAHSYTMVSGDQWQENLYREWEWSMFLRPEAIYYNILPMYRIDVETGNVTDWGISNEEYTEASGFAEPSNWDNRIAGGSGYIMTLVSNPPPEGMEPEEMTTYTCLIYREDGEPVYTITDIGY